MRRVSWKELINLPNGTYLREEERGRPFFGIVLTKIHYDFKNNEVIFREVETGRLVVTNEQEANELFNYYVLWEEK